MKEAVWRGSRSPARVMLDLDDRLHVPVFVRHEHDGLQQRYFRFTLKWRVNRRAGSDGLCFAHEPWRA